MTGNSLVQNSPIIVALDYPNADAALAMAANLDPKDCRVKVGKELFTRCGPQILDGLHKQGFDVFLDLLYFSSSFFFFISLIPKDQTAFLVDWSHIRNS